MWRFRYLQIFLTGFFLGIFTVINGQENFLWQPIQPPIYQDCKQIQKSNDQLYVNAGKLLIFKDSIWQFFPVQPPFQINKMFVLKNNKIFVSNETNYQNSELYFWDGQQWNKIKHPVANNISDMYFSDEQNGILTSYGEIVVLENGHFRHLNPPSNHYLKQIGLLNNKLYVLAQKKGIFKYENKQWKKIKTPEKIKKIYSVPNRILATGKDFLLEITDNHTKILSKNSVWGEINSITEYHKSIIGVGNHGIIVQLSLSEIKKSILPEKINLHQIIFAQDKFWIVGDKGSIYCSTTQPVYKKPFWKGFKQLTFNQNAKIIDDEYGVVIADFNNDHKPDIFTCGLFEEDHLYINLGNMQFSDQSVKFGLNNENTKENKKLNLGACAGDIDNDGDIDLYISVLNGKNIIYKNENGAYFIDYSSISGGTGETNDRTNACIMGDVDNDGDLDIFITNEFSSNRLYVNNGAGIFKEVTQKTGLTTPGGGNSATFGDIDNDGDIDLFVTNWSQPNILYKNLLKETGKLQFENITKPAGVGGKAYEKSNAVIITDLNNDGYPDIFITNRKSSNKLYINNKNNTFKDFSGVLIPIDQDESYGAVITDFDGDQQKDIYVSNVGKNKFYQFKNGKWSEQSTHYSAGINGYSTGSAISDLDLDGDPDIYVANYVGASSSILQNNASEKQFATLQFNLYQNNQKGIGSKIYLYQKNNSKLLYATEVTAGTGYVSKNDSQLLIPVNDSIPSFLKIIFPNGQKKIIENIHAQSYTISDLNGIKANSYKIKNFLIRQLYDPHRFYELIKWFLIILFIWYTNHLHRIKFGWNKSFMFFISLLLIFLYYIQYKQFEFQSFIYATILPIASIILLNLLIHYYFERKIIKYEAQIKQQEIKYKLSRNLHDDLAATISSIGFYLTMIKSNLKKPSRQTSQLIQKAEELLQDATGTITDLIWSIRPQPETLESLVLRIQKNFKDLFHQKNIHFKIQWKKNDIKKLKIGDTLKQNIYLIIKEALNNILKYAEATHVEIYLSQQNNTVEIIISDNGKGFDTTLAQNKGNGLQNMKTRAFELPQGSFEIKTNTEGTQIMFRFLIEK